MSASSMGSTARPNWDETWLSVARTVARRSLCSRDQVGAVVVSATNRLLETGFNGPPSGFQHNDKTCTSWCLRAQGGPLDRDYASCPSLHAEMNALLRGDRNAREGGTIYVTSHVCMGCAKAIANSGLENLYVDSSITDPVWRSPKQVYEFLDQCGISVMIA